MRLFIAVALPEDVRKALALGAARVRADCLRGSFPREENSHLTVCFLGETAPERLGAVTEAMETVSSPPLALTIGPMGRFSSRSGDILYRAVDAGDELFALQRSLREALSARGFPMEKRAYIPHLTVARRAALREGASLRSLSEALPPVRFTARELTLFRSDQRRGARIYTPIHQKSLQ